MAYWDILQEHLIHSPHNYKINMLIQQQGIIIILDGKNNTLSPSHMCKTVWTWVGVWDLLNIRGIFIALFYSNNKETLCNSWWHAKTKMYD